jgi:hypothetical protein
LPAVQEESGELPTFEDSSDSEIPEG